MSTPHARLLATALLFSVAGCDEGQADRSAQQAREAAERAEPYVERGIGTATQAARRAAPYARRTVEHAKRTVERAEPYLERGLRAAAKAVQRIRRAASATSRPADAGASDAGAAQP